MTSTTQNLPPQQQYQQIMAECQQLMGKIAELEIDRNEHQLVEETLQPLDPSRRAYRLVGEVLVERTVQEVLPSVSSNKENVSIPSMLEFKVKVKVNQGNILDSSSVANLVPNPSIQFSFLLCSILCIYSFRRQLICCEND